MKYLTYKKPTGIMEYNDVQLDSLKKKQQNAEDFMDPET